MMLRRTAEKRNIGVCDACRAELELTPVERVEPDGSLLMVLICPSCAAEYAIVRVTAKGVQLRAQLLRLGNRGLTHSWQYMSLAQRYRREVTPLARTERIEQPATTQAES